MYYLTLRLGVTILVSFLYILPSATFGQGVKSTAATEHFNNKNYKKVVELLNANVETLGKADLFLLAKSHSCLKNHLNAIKIYQSLVAQFPKDFEALTLLGGELLQIGKSSEGLTHLKEALSINPKYGLAYKILIQHYEKSNNKYELRLLYEDSISHMGEQFEAILKLCELTATDRLYDLAFRYCQKGISKSPRLPQPYIFLAHSYRDTGDFENAENTYKKAAKIFSKSEEAQIAYAKFLEEQKNFPSAYNYYKNAVKANPSSLLALLGQARTGFEMQKFEESLSIFENNCKKDKAAVSGFRHAVSALRLQKNNSSAKVWLNKFENSLFKCESF